MKIAGDAAAWAKVPINRRRSHNAPDGTIDAALLEALRLAGVNGRDIAVYEGQGVYYESLCLWAGARPTTIRERRVDNRSTRVTAMTTNEWEQSRTQFPFAIAMQVAQLGLGAFGETVDPDADLAAMRRLKTIVKPGGRLFLMVPLGADRLHWNVSRVYGPLRWPLLSEGWALVRPATITRDQLTTGGPDRMLLVLENLS